MAAEDRPVDIRALHHNRAEVLAVMERYRSASRQAGADDRRIYAQFLARLEVRLHDIDYEINRREGNA